MSLAPDKEAEKVARLPRALVGGVLVLCVLPFLLLWAGVDLSTPELKTLPFPDGTEGVLTDELPGGSGSFLHSLSEWTSTCLALFTALLAFLYIYQKPDPLVLIIGISMLLTGLLEAAHTFASHELREVVFGDQELISLTWSSSSLAKAFLLGTGAALLVWRQPTTRRLGFGALLVLGLAFGVVSYFIAHTLAGSHLAPVTYLPDSLIRRPWDMPPLILFLGCGLFLFPRLLRSHPGLFSQALLLSVFPEVVSQIHVVFGSSRLYDSHFNIAHFLEIVALSVPLIAFALYFVQASRRELTATERLEKAVGGLKREARERKQTEEALRKAEARNQAILSGIPDLIFRLNKDLVYLDYHAKNDAELQIPPSEFLGKKLPEIFPEQAQKAGHAVRAALQTGSVQTIEYRLENRGKSRDYEARIVKSGEEEVLIMIRDITDQKHLERQILEISSREQQRIGHDLHDGLSQQLAGIALLGKALHQRLAAKSLAEASDAHRIVDLVNDTMAQTRNLARGLSPVQLEEQGLLAALEELALGVESFHSVSCRFRCADKILIEDHATATHLYRIAQEAVNNALRHAEPSQINIELEKSNEHCTLTVRDNGKGIPDDSASGNGMGLHIMQYRARMIDASLDIRRAPKGGTMVVCELARDSVESKAGVR